jgi:hypothetical protein
MNTGKGPGPPEAIQDAAVIAVVIAGVLSSFTIPGPFDWGASLIGVILLVVLLAYGTWPRELTVASFRRALGMAAAGAFCVLLILGRPVDAVLVDTDDGRRHLLSRWPSPSQRRDDDVPDPDAGWELALLWVGLFSVLILVWAVVEWRRAK